MSEKPLQDLEYQMDSEMFIQFAVDGGILLLLKVVEINNFKFVHIFW